MRVFVTGASGHLGSAVVPELVRSGHHVVGLARSDTSAAALSAAGAQVHRGDLDDPAGLAAAAAAADGVIHLAFKHDAMAAGDYEGAVAADLRVVEALGHALAGTGKPLVGTSGTLGFAGLGRILTEADTLGTGPRVDAENAVVALAERGIRSSVVRLTPTVHSALDHHGFIPALISVARRSGVAAYVGDGANRWPAVHTLDAARLYRLALESAPAGRGCTPWAMSRFLSAGSPRSSAAGWACPSPGSRRRRRRPTSASSPLMSRPTIRPRAS